MRINKRFSDDSYLTSFKPVEVIVNNNNKNKDSRDELEDAIRVFRGLVTKERIMSVLKEHASYEKPSDKKRRKRREAERRLRKIAMGKFEEDGME
jgi:small subunit ribosomal protein S21